MLHDESVQLSVTLSVVFEGAEKGHVRYAPIAQATFPPCMHTTIFFGYYYVTLQNVRALLAGLFRAQSPPPKFTEWHILFSEESFMASCRFLFQVVTDCMRTHWWESPSSRAVAWPQFIV